MDVVACENPEVFLACDEHFLSILFQGKGKSYTKLHLLNLFLNDDIADHPIVSGIKDIVLANRSQFTVSNEGSTEWQKLEKILRFFNLIGHASDGGELNSDTWNLSRFGDEGWWIGGCWDHGNLVDDDFSLGLFSGNSAGGTEDLNQGGFCVERGGDSVKGDFLPGAVSSGEVVKWLRSGNFRSTHASH